MIKETILKNFTFWDAEKQLSEYQAYKALGTYSPFSEDDYTLMEMVMNNPNAEVACEDGVCEIVATEESMEAMDEAHNVEPGTTKKAFEEEGLVEAKKYTQEEADKMSKELKTLSKRYPHKVISDDGKVFDTVFDALQKEFKYPGDFLDEIMDYRGSIDYDVDLKGDTFSVEINKGKSNEKKLLDIAGGFGIWSIALMAQYTDDDVEDIDSETFKKAEILLK